MKPTAWLKELPPEDGNGMMMTIIEEVAKEWEEPVIPLYSKGAWVALTEEDIDDAEIHLASCRNNHESWIEGIQEFAQAIEAKLKEKNNG